MSLCQNLQYKSEDPDPDEIFQAGYHLDLLQESTLKVS
jgi:hypothetical protein